MKQCLIYGAFLMSFILSALPLNAQQTEGPDRVHLRSGETVSGTIVAYKPNDYVRVAIADGRVKTYLMEAVLQIQQGVGINPVEAEATAGEEVEDLNEEEIEQISFTGKPPMEASGKTDKNTNSAAKATYEFRERGLFNATSFAFSFGNRKTTDEPIFNPFGPSFESEKTAIGFNIQHITGFQFNRMLGLGVGLSYDAYDLEEGEAIMTIFGHYRGYLTKSIVSPYLGLSGGYGFAFTNEEQGISEAEGGWMIHPEIGVRLGASAKTNFTISVGYRMQEAHYTQELPFNGDIQYRDLVYRRFLFSLGLLF